MDVSEDSSDHLKSYGFSSLNGWAVTYPNNFTITHQWTIREFLQVYKSAGDIKSGLFEGQFKGKGGKGYQWQLRVRKQFSSTSGREFISVHLYLVKDNQHNPLRPKAKSVYARFQITLLDISGNVFRRAGGEDSDTRLFEQSRGWGFNNFCLVEHLRNHTADLLPAGELFINCKLWMQDPALVREGRGGNLERNTDQPSNSERLANDLGTLLRGGFGSDFTIVVAGSQKTFPVHKVVLAARSPVFKAMLNAPVKESQENTVLIEDFDSEVVAAMLEYMYTGSISQEILGSRAPDLLKISDYYFLHELCEECENVVSKKIDVNNAMEVLLLSCNLNCSMLKEEALHFVNAHKKEVKETAAFQRICKEYPELIVDLYLV